MEWNVWSQGGWKMDLKVNHKEFSDSCSQIYWKHDDDLQTKVINCGGLPLLLQAYKKGSRIKSCWKISSNTAGSKDRIELVIAAKYWEPEIAMCKRRLVGLCSMPLLEEHLTRSTTWSPGLAYHLFATWPSVLTSRLFKSAWKTWWIFSRLERTKPLHQGLSTCMLNS